MKWSWNVARVKGTDVKIHFTFLLLLAWIGLSGLASGGLPGAVISVIFVVLIFGCVLLHEFGHVLAARSFGVRTPDITLYPIGGVARLERMPEKPYQELIVAMAGPAVNVVIAALLLLIVGAGVTLGGVETMADPGAALLTRLAAVNIWLVIFNLIPAFPMDGGRVLRALLGMRMSFLRATRYASKVGRFIAVVFGVIGFFVKPILLFIAIFVYFGAKQELTMVEMRQRAFAHGQSPFEAFRRSPLVDEVLHRSRPRRRDPVPVIDESGHVVDWVSDDNSRQ